MAHTAVDEIRLVRQLRMRIDTLETEVERLFQENASFKLSVVNDTVSEIMAALKVTRCQSIMIDALMKRETVTRPQMAHTLWTAKGLRIREKSLDVQMSHVRRRLKPLGIVINTLWGKGWELSSSAKRTVKRLLDDYRKSQRVAA